MMTASQSSKKDFSRSNPWRRLRAQFGGALLFGLIIPVGILSLLYEDLFRGASAQYTAGGIASAIAITVYLFRNISRFSGLTASIYYILPVSLTAYIVVFSFFAFLRLDYSRALFISSLLGTLSWLYIAELLAERGAALKIAVVPLGNVGMIEKVANVDIKWLTEPYLDDDCQMLVADFRADMDDKWEAFIAETALNGMPVLHVKQLVEAATGRVEIEHLSENSFGSLIPFIGYLRFRRFIDTLTALLAAIVFSPLLLIVALLVRLDSPGPSLFRQMRIGYRGQPFQVFKFRTMTVAGPEANILDRAKTKDNDARVTRLGRFLRRSRIDELPQILNILRGDMSWIGPRPEAASLSEWYQSELPFYRYRHIVPPGITGWAQVNQGHVVELDDVLSKLHYDFFYIKNFSLWLDAVIVVRTVQTILTGFGAK